MAGGSASIENAYHPIENLFALVVVVLFALAGGFAIGAVNGYNFWKLKTKPLLGPVRIPALVVMILCGAVARNLHPYQRQAYNDGWASYIR